MVMKLCEVFFFTPGTASGINLLAICVLVERWNISDGPFYGHCMSSDLTRTPLSQGGGGEVRGLLKWRQWERNSILIAWQAPHSSYPTPHQGFPLLSLHPFILWPPTCPPARRTSYEWVWLTRIYNFPLYPLFLIVPGSSPSFFFLNTFHPRL